MKTRVTVGATLTVEHAPRCLAGHADPDPRSKASSDEGKAAYGPVQDGAARVTLILRGLPQCVVAPMQRGGSHQFQFFMLNLWQCTQ